jgi:hypothetical protein
MSFLSKIRTGMSAYILGRLCEMNVISLFSVECFIYKLVLTNILVSLNPSSQEQFKGSKKSWPPQNVP